MLTDDMELAREYARSNSEQAFAALVSRHVNLVYSVAMRQVQDPHLAEDISQAVFVILAQKAKALGPKTILPGWLCRTARNVSADVLKAQRRRQLREQESQMQSIAHESEASAWEQIAPMLEEALNCLGEKEHDAIVLRFFGAQELKQVGAALGTTEDGARMRVNRGIEKLRKYFLKRGVALSATAIAGAVAAHSVQAAPAGLVATVTAAALSGTTITTMAIVAAGKAITMTTLQKAVVAATVAVLAGAGIYEARQAANARAEVQTLQQLQTPLTEQVQKLAGELDEATNKLRVALAEDKQWRSDAAELPKLRARLTRLSLELAQLKTEGIKVSDEPLASVADSWAKRAVSFKRWFQENPDKSIPELQFLKEGDWLFTASRNLVIATNELQRREHNSFAMVASDLRETAKGRFATVLGRALSNYIAANAGALPGDLSQLTPFFASQSDDYSAVVLADPSILQRYQLLRTGQISDVAQEEPIVVERQPVDLQVDTLLMVKVGAHSFQSVGIIDMMAGRPLSWSQPDLDRIQPFLKKAAP